MCEDINLAVLCGRLATDPDVVTTSSGSSKIDFLVSVYARQPARRIDVVPVTLFDPPAQLLDDLPGANSRVWVTGAVQRRGNEGPEGRRTGIRLIADQVTVLGSNLPCAARR